MIAVVLALACTPTPPPEHTWRGEQVAAHRESHLRLDEWPSIVCSPPEDEDLIMRLMQGWMTLFVSTYAGPRQPYLFQLAVTGVSTVDPYASSYLSTTQKVQGAYEVAANVSYWEVMDDVFTDMQNEQDYDVGIDWPHSPHVYNMDLDHNLSGSIEHAGGYNEDIGRSESWEDENPVYNPFYPFQVCNSRVRPDRFQGTFWFDVSETEWHGDSVTTPVYLAWDVSDGVFNNLFDPIDSSDVGKASVEYNFASASWPQGKGPRWANQLSTAYYDDLTEADIFPAVEEDQ